VLAAVLGAGLLAGCARERPSAPVPVNVLLVSIDTLRADRLGCYGAEAVETPAIDRLATEGVRFENAFSPVPLTLPAHWTIHTGVEPWHHGVVDNGMTLQTPPVATLAERFAAAGYDTAAFVAAFVLHRSFGLDRGFARYDDGPAADAALDQAFHATAPADERVGRALAWLRKARSRPFFLWLHLYDPHAPYQPPAAFRALYEERLYDGEIAFVDTQVARLLAALEDSGVADRTLVVVLSDHGESLGEHGETTHGVLLYDSTLRIPLVFRLPGAPGGASVRQDAATLADVAPTVLALAGLPPEAGLDGIDLFARRQPPGRQLAAISETPHRRLGWASLVAIREGPWKYILAPRSELYRLAEDPHELADRLSSEPAVTAELDGAARRVAGALRRVLDKRGTTEPALEEQARLAALGYLQGAADEATRGADPKDAIGFLAGLDRANQLIGEGRLAEAEAAFRVFADQDPPPLAALEGLGRIALLQGRQAAAESSYARLAALDPDSVTARAQLVQLARQRGDLATALERARQLVRLAPRDGGASRLLAETLLAAGEPAAAETEWRRGLEVAPRSHWLRLSFATYLLRARRQGEAARELDRIVGDEEAPEEVVRAAQDAIAGLGPTP
jgi:choline-sulfatase